jgi:tetratricopeptide (TPR) repeat protein
MTKKIFLGLMTYFLLFAAFSALPSEINAQSKKDIQKAKKLTTEGDEFFRQRNYQLAVDRYAEASALVPKNGYARFWKGYSHYYLNQFEQASSDLDAALTLGFKPLEIYRVRWEVNYKNKNYDAALSDVQQALKLDPGFYYNNALGDIYRGKGDWQNALAAYRTAAQLEPNNPDVNYWIAFVSYNLGDTKTQETAAQEAVKRNTQYMGESFFLIGDALYKAKRIDEAMKTFERVVNMKPAIAEVYAPLSDIYRSQGRFKDAIAITKKGLELHPENGNLYISLSWYYSLDDKHKEAVEAGEKAISFAPEQSMGFTNLCRAYNDIRKYEDAIKTCNQALKLNPNDGETNFYLGRAYNFLKNTDTAAQYYKKAVIGLEEFTRSNPDYSDGFYLLGNAYFSDGQREKAIEAYKKSLELSPNFAKVRYNLGYLYFLKNDTGAAREQYEALKKIDYVTAEKLKQAMEKK